MSKFDNEEHFYLALDSISKSNHSSAIWHLKSMKTGDYFDKGLYLLANEYAELGMYQKAKEKFLQAAQYEDFREIGEFQLGLLHLTLGDINLAQNAFLKLLDITGDKLFIACFSKGLLEIISENIDVGETLIMKGVELNKVNLPLNNDIINFLNKIKAAHITSAGKPSEMAIVGVSSEGRGENQFLLTNYKNKAI